MDRKINELKLEDIQAVVGGITTAATMVVKTSSVSSDRAQAVSASSLQGQRVPYGG